MRVPFSGFIFVSIQLFPAIVMGQDSALGHTSHCLNVYQESLFECDVTNYKLNNPAEERFLCGLSDMLLTDLDLFMIEVRDMLPSSDEWPRICSILEPIAKVGHQVSTQGSTEDSMAQIRGDLQSARWQIASMHELLQFNF